jgi:hypothetical protein
MTTELPEPTDPDEGISTTWDHHPVTGWEQVGTFDPDEETDGGTP